MTMAHIRSILLATLLVACAGRSEPAPLPRPSGDPRPGDADSRVILDLDYEGSASVERRDSILLALPDGGRQLQQLSRSARFSFSIDRRGELRVRLDSLRLRPAGGKENEVIGTTWTGRLGPDGVRDLRANRRGALVGELTAEVAALFPAIPRSGVASGDTWADTSKDKRQVEIFEASDERVAEWSVGRRTTRDGVLVLPVTARETYQQLGEGQQAGRAMRMSAEGRRSTTYYLTLTGRIDAIVATDTASRLITIPATRQAVPTTQIVRTRVQFRAPR
jgi:hypothetical protein